MTPKIQEPAIIVNNVNKTFRLPHERVSSIKSLLLTFHSRSRTFERQYALNDISFEVRKGEFFGIVGRNGSGKSTLLKLLAGIYSPNKGTIHVHGKLTPFIELGVGFNPELTGRENVFLNGALLGFNRKEMNEMYGDIVKFAELERFMDQKLKNYSSGMQVRLAFSIAVRARSDILLIDEVLAVGDAAFQRKCYDYFMKLKKNKQTVIVVTHDMEAVRTYCDRAIMIDGGTVVKRGAPEKVAQAYQRLFIEEAAEEAAQEKSQEAEDGSRWGLGGLTATRTQVSQTKETITISVQYKAATDVSAPIFGFTVYGPTGVNILEGNTKRMKQKTEDIASGNEIKLKWTIPNIFADGVYTVSVACCDMSATRFYDWLNEAAVFKIRKESSTAGTVDPVILLEEYEVKTEN